MKIHRKRFKTGDHFELFVKVSLTADEMKLYEKMQMDSVRVRTSGSSFGGTSISTDSLSFQQLIRRIKNRWNIAINRTSGFVLIDFLVMSIKLFLLIFYIILRGFFGTRTRFRKLLSGKTFRESRIEKIFDTEINVLMTIAAVHCAIREYRFSEEDIELDAENYKRILPGLDFTNTMAPVASTALLSSLERLIQGHVDWEDEAVIDVGEAGLDAEVVEIAET